MPQLKIEIEENTPEKVPEAALQIKVKHQQKFRSIYSKHCCKFWRKFKLPKFGHYAELRKLKDQEALKSTSFFRIIRNSLQNFGRNGLLSFATTIVMLLAVFSILVAMMVTKITSSAIQTINSKVDFMLELVDGADQDEVDDLVADLRILPVTAQVTYVSKEAALAEFQERYQDLPQFLRDYHLNNPLPAHITIVAKDPKYFPEIKTFLEKPDYRKLLNSESLAPGNLQEQRSNKLLDITNITRNAVYLISFILVLIAVLIIMNTTRLTIFSRQDEIFIMRLVGASRSFLNGPFVVEGILYGLLGSFLSCYFFFYLLENVAAGLSNYFEQDILSYYDQNFWPIFLGTLFLGALLGGISSLLATQKYLSSHAKL